MYFMVDTVVDATFSIYKKTQRQFIKNVLHIILDDNIQPYTFAEYDPPLDDPEYMKIFLYNDRIFGNDHSLILFISIMQNYLSKRFLLLLLISLKYDNKALDNLLIFVNTNPNLTLRDLLNYSNTIIVFYHENQDMFDVIINRLKKLIEDSAEQISDNTDNYSVWSNSPYSSTCESY